MLGQEVARKSNVCFPMAGLKKSFVEVGRGGTCRAGSI